MLIPEQRQAYSTEQTSAAEPRGKALPGRCRAKQCIDQAGDDGGKDSGDKRRTKGKPDHVHDQSENDHRNNARRFTLAPEQQNEPRAHNPKDAD